MTLKLGTITSQNILNDEETLKSAARKIQEQIREGEGWVGRQGGEEFVVFLHDLSQKEVITFAERLQKIINSMPTSSEPRGIKQLGISIGITEYKTADDYTDALKRADEVVNFIKKHVPGKNAIRTYEEISGHLSHYEQLPLFDIDSLK